MQKNKPDYAMLTRKIYFRIIFLAVLAVSVILIFRQLMRNRIAEWIVLFIRDAVRIDYYSALDIYNNLFRSNYNMIMLAAIIICFVILSRYLLSLYSKYFNEISEGLDSLVKESEHEIQLSPEMAAMEQKINKIRRTLEQRELETQAAEQRKNDMVMYLAHDIKTPLTSVIGYLSLLDEVPEMPPEQKAKYVHITLNKAYRLEKLIDEFFEITRYNFQMNNIAAEPIDLYYLLTQMIEEFYPVLSAQGKQALLYVPEDMTVNGDPDKLARVFNNILKNAAAYSPGNSIIKISATAGNDYIAIIFQNEGSIPENKLESIFDKFYRLDSARSSNTGGAGLGLAIAKEIIHSHGGSIYAESDGTHTSFIVELPIG